MQISSERGLEGAAADTYCCEPSSVALEFGPSVYYSAQESSTSLFSIVVSLHILNLTLRIQSLKHTFPLLFFSRTAFQDVVM